MRIAEIQCRSVYNNAFAALWKATGDMKLVVPYWVRCLDGLPKRDSKKRGRQALFAEIGAIQLRKLGKESPTDLANVLIKLLAAERAIHRRNAARALGALGRENEKFKVVMKSLQTERYLRKLLEDRDATVRAEARAALNEESSFPPRFQMKKERSEITPVD